MRSEASARFMASERTNGWIVPCRSLLFRRDILTILTLLAATYRILHKPNQLTVTVQGDAINSAPDMSAITQRCMASTTGSMYRESIYPGLAVLPLCSARWRDRRGCEWNGYSSDQPLLRSLHRPVPLCGFPRWSHRIAVYVCGRRSGFSWPSVGNFSWPSSPMQPGGTNP